MPEPIVIRNDAHLRLEFSPSGELQAIRHASTLINQVVPLAVEDSLMRLAVRIGSPPRCVVPLTGLSATASMRGVTDRSVQWEGAGQGIRHETSVVLHPRLPIWYWHVRLRNEGAESLELDVVYGQDLGLAHVHAVTNNEAYVCQYIDHLPVNLRPQGWIILSRQNQAQVDSGFPWVAQGCVDGAVAYGTDGFQFFGQDYRVTGRPRAWDHDLPSQRRQYEFAYIGLQTGRVELPPGDERTFTFFASFEPDHPRASAEEDVARVLAQVLSVPAASKIVRQLPGLPAGTLLTAAPPLAGETLTATECRELFPEPWRHVEERDGDLLSFFHGASRHVMTRAKEARVERPQGHLLRSGHALWPEPDVLGTTVYACGIFNAQIFLGNTNLARFLSVVRNPLNVMRASGQRVFVRIEGQWRQLGVASAFEVGLREARWLYRLGPRLIEARTCCWAGRPAATLELRVLAGAATEFLVTHHVALGVEEQSMPAAISVDTSAGAVVCRPAAGSMLDRHLPGTALAIVAGNVGEIERFGGPDLIGAGMEPHAAPLIVFQTRAVSRCSITLAPLRPEDGTLPDLVANLRASNPGGAGEGGLPLAELRLAHPSDEGVARLGEIVPWLSHNAAIHLAVPHGLEQYGGAAWGVRDVCQGPTEWLLAAGRYAEVRRILLDVFAQQYGDDGSWPQWYMHAPFDFIRQEHAHGDIPFWPLKALCDYVEAANDFSVLRERVPYRPRPSETHGREAETVTAHVDRILAHYRRRCLGTTALIDYGDGDWDDTLQPADPSLRSTLVSSWTVGLVYHAFRQWREVCLRDGQAERAEALAPVLESIRHDFTQLLVIDGQVCGFALQDGARLRPLLHPADTATAIHHRLLPMTRGILAELFNPSDARHHAGLIRDHLLFPDGVRLMSSPVPYRGGVETTFKRAESAANFGREIGLQYVHAHLRYAEAMAKLGEADALWRALQVVNPVRLDALLPHAALRQSNAYFSSSDGDFADRYEAAANFGRLRDGSVAVKGGWRIYSSGPGLYLHKVVTCLLGLRATFGEIVLDPVLPAALDGLTARLTWAGKAIELRYGVGQDHTPRAVRVNGQAIPVLRRSNNSYRSGGVVLSRDAFHAGLDQALNGVEIDL